MIINNTFKNNSAVHGGVIYLRNLIGHIENNVFSNNTALTGGGVNFICDYNKLDLCDL